MNAERWKQIDELFDDCLEIAPTDHSVFLKEQCGADENLRLRVEKLLASVDEAENFLEATQLESAFWLLNFDKSAWLAVAVSPDGTRFALGGLNSVVQIYDLKSNTLLLEMKQHTAKINGLAFSPDGKLLASASSDRTIRFFKTGKGTEVRNLSVHFEDAWSVAFSPDGKFIAIRNLRRRISQLESKELKNKEIENSFTTPSVRQTAILILKKVETLKEEEKIFI